MARSENRDPEAGALLKHLREERGLSREQLPHAMLLAGVPRANIPAIRTVWNVEELGVIPRARIKFGLANFYDRTLGEIWAPQPTRSGAVAA